MDSAANIMLYDPTIIVLSAFTLKDVPYRVAKERKVLTDIPGPALSYHEHAVAGEAAVLGWLDRRYPFPALFPADLENYGRASTIAHALTTDPNTCIPFYDMLANTCDAPFILGRHPCIADVALLAAMHAVEHPQLPDFAQRLEDYVQ